MTAKTASALKAQAQGTDFQDQINDIVDSAMAAASDTAAGRVELATDAETQTGTDTARAVTPAGLAATTSTATRAGVVELATNAESRTGTDTARAVTPANLRNVLTGLKTISFDGRNGAGACTATGAVVGDKVISVHGITSGALGAATASFEATITVADQIQQSSAGNLSANDYVVLLLAVA